MRIPLNPYPYEYHVFLSYTTREDEIKKVKPFLCELGELLREIGLKTPIFVDSFILEPRHRTSNQLRKELKQALNESASMVALISPGYIESGWCNFEWDDMDRRIHTIKHSFLEGFKMNMKPSMILPIIWKELSPSHNTTRNIPGMYPSITIDGDVRELTPPKREDLFLEVLYFVDKCCAHLCYPREKSYIPCLSLWPRKGRDKWKVDPSSLVSFNPLVGEILGIRTYSNTLVKWKDVGEVIYNQNKHAMKELEEAIYFAAEDGSFSQPKQFIRENRTGRFYRMYVSSANNYLYPKIALEYGISEWEHFPYSLIEIWFIEANIWPSMELPDF